MEDFVSAISATVIFLFAGDPPRAIGTGFIVGFPVDDQPNATIPLIVTAKHVVGDHKKLLGRFSTQAGKSTAFVQYDVDSLRANKDYWEHPDEGVDIALFRSLHFQETRYVAFPIDFIATKEVFKSEEIHQTDRIIFPALLINFVGSSRNYPVIRDGTIALMPEEKVPLKYRVGSKEIVTQQEVLLLDATSVPGASGSPIFLWPGPRIKGNAFTLGGNKPYLLGVMHGFYPAAPRDLIEVEPAKTAQMYAENSGIAIVFPSWRLREILDLPQVTGRISEIVQQKKERAP
jgi:hypothetical protein